MRRRQPRRNLCAVLWPVPPPRTSLSGFLAAEPNLHFSFSGRRICFDPSSGLVTTGGVTMVLAYLAASIAKQGGRPPSPRSAMALMAALLAAQITWTVTKHQTNFGNRATSAAVASDASVVDDGGFSLALGVRRGEEGAAGGAAAGGVREPRPRNGRGNTKTQGDGFESWWLGELDDPPRK